LIEAGKISEEEVHNRISVKTIQDLTLVRQDGSKVNNISHMIVHV